jgi:3-hydroxy-9,10-secoandrosta-1,3,5(10)-triene-9,17-dione monooxygenase reductase component
MTEQLAFDSAKYRQVLGHFPTGVTVITAASEGVPVGLAVGSFSSVSLSPPLVAFFPDKGSSSWPKIEETGSFCVNILGEDQEEVCRRFASKGDDKFAGLGWSPASSGSPLLKGVLAWIDCNIDSVTDAGDHFCVIGRVRDLGVEHEHGPLVFFRGGYGRFAV